MTISKSILLNTDSYKVGMFSQYPEGTTLVYSYIESRGGIYDEVVAGLIHPFIQEYLMTPFTQEDLDFAYEIWDEFSPIAPKEQVAKMLQKHDGYWPVSIYAVPEGTIVGTKQVLAVVVNSDPEFPFATTWIETALLRAYWYTSTVATNSREIGKVILNYLEKSGTPELLKFKLHDFGARGVSSFESAGLGAMSHGINFNGSDTMTGALAIREYYGDKKIVSSIFATEHSTVTSWGKESERDAYAHMIKTAGKPGAIFACVSDSYNIYNACHIWGSLKDDLVASGATLVVRPDSGDPLVVIPKCMQILEQYYGSTTNSKGFKVLNHVAIIWGDGITKLTIESILRVAVNVYGWSADNFAFGQGGALLQDVTRDDQKYAMKCSLAVVNGIYRDVFKSPITDSGKESKRGDVWLYQNPDTSEFVTMTLDEKESSAIEYQSAMVLMYENGVQYNKTSFEEIRNRASL